MKDFRIRQVILIGLLIISTAVVRDYSTNNVDSKLTNLVDDFPFSLGGWIGKNSPLEEKTFDILGTRSIIVREYQKQGNVATLAIVYHENNESKFHQPEACLGGIGYTILDEGTKKILPEDNLAKSIYVNSMQYSRDKTRELIYYFYQTGNTITSSYLQFRWKMLLNQLRFKQTNAALIRVSTPIGPNYPTEAVLSDFLSELLPHLNGYFRLSTIEEE